MSNEIEDGSKPPPPPSEPPPPPEKKKEITLGTFVALLLGPAAVLAVGWFVYALVDTGFSSDFVLGTGVLVWIVLLFGGFVLSVIGILQFLWSAVRRNKDGHMRSGGIKAVVGMTIFLPALVLAPVLLFQGDDYQGEQFSSEIIQRTVVLSEEQWRVDFDVSAHEADGTPIDLSLVEVFARADDPEMGQVTIRSEGTGDGTIFIFSNSIDDGSIEVHWSMQVPGGPFNGRPVLVVEPIPTSD